MSQAKLEILSEQVTESERWQWFDELIEHEHQAALIIEHNRNVKPKFGIEGVEPPLILKDELLDFKPQLIITAAEVLKATNYHSDKFKVDRADKVKAIKVTVGTKEFDGDEDSQTRMARAIITLERSSVESTMWRLADNTVADVTIDELSQALLLAGQAQTDVWMP